MSPIINLESGLLVFGFTVNKGVFVPIKEILSKNSFIETHRRIYSNKSTGIILHDFRHMYFMF
jgi:hypothetical protein